MKEIWQYNIFSGFYGAIIIENRAKIHNVNFKRPISQNHKKSNNSIKNGPNDPIFWNVVQNNEGKKL